MDTTSFTALFDWVSHHGYPFVFLAMCAEGPGVTAAAGFASSLGYFSVFIIFILSLLGDLIPDTIYYFIGFFGRSAAKKWEEKKFHLSASRVNKLDHHIKTHGVKTLVALKFAPFLSIPGLITVGAARMPFWRFFFVCLAVSAPRNLLFLLLGYFGGQFFKKNSGSWEQAELFIVIAGMVLVFVFLLYRRLAKYMSKRIEEV